MVDCADRDRIDEAKQELHRIINDREMKDAIILIFANKQDLPDGELCSINPRTCYAETAKKLWHCVPFSARTMWVCSIWNKRSAQNTEISIFDGQIVLAWDGEISFMET